MHSEPAAIQIRRFARRNFLGASVAMAGMSAAGQTLAQPVAEQVTPRVKGPRIWLDMDQTDLDDAFDMFKAAPNLPQITRRYASNSEAVRSRLGEPRRFAYGPTAIEALDVYTTKAANAPINVFLHGGAFSMGLAKYYAFPAELFVRAGAHLVVPDFARPQDLDGSIVPLADQVRHAVAWVYRNAKSFGGDPDRIFVCGHSSGGELAGNVLTTDWRKDFDLPADLVKGGLCCSATFDLKGFRLSAASAKFRITDEMEQALSTRRHIDKLSAPLIVAFGSRETAFFQSQAREFAADVQAAGKPVQLLVAEGYNHFEVIETLANPYGLLGRAVLEQMKLNRA